MNASKPVYSKKMNASERLHYVSPNSNVIFAARFSQQLDISTHLPDILEKISLANPILKTRIVIDPADQNMGEYVYDPAITPGFEIVQVHWEQQVLQELSYRFSPSRGPMIRFIYCPGEEDVLVINSHHAIIDGRSMIYLIRDIISLLQGIEVSYRPTPDIDDDDIPVALGSFLERKIMGLIARRWKKARIEIPGNLQDEFYKRFWKDQEPRIRNVCIQEERLAQMLMASKKQGVAFTAMLTTMILIAQEKAQLPQDFLRNVTISVDYRQRLKNEVNDEFGLFASAIRIKLEHDLDRPFWSIAREIQGTIEKYLVDKKIFQSQQIRRLPPSFIDALQYGREGLIDQATVKKMVKSTGMNRYSFGFLLTNLGKIDAYGFPSIKDLEWMAGPFVYSPTMQKYIGMITCNNKLYISISYNQQQISDQNMDEFAKKFMELIIQL